MEQLPTERARLVENDTTVQPAPKVDPAELRTMAARLLYVASTIDATADTHTRKHSLVAVGRNEHGCLAAAEAEYHARRKRCSFFSQALLGEPAWDILLDLFIQKARGKCVSVTSACYASGVPTTTALRWLSALEDEGMIERIPAIHDRRVHHLQLTDSAESALAQWLRHRALL